MATGQDDEPVELEIWIAALDPTPGGIFRVDMNGRGVARGVPPGTTTVEIDLLPERGGTRLRLRHSGLRGDNRARHAGGWTHYSARLRSVAEGGSPGPDPLASPDVAHG